MTSEVRSLRGALRRAESSPREALELAAARAEIDALSLMNDCANASGFTRRELAAALHVTEGRVSQILNGDGNVRVSTLARVLRALGLRLTLGAERASAGRRRSANSQIEQVERSMKIRVFFDTIDAGNHVSRRITLVEGDVDPVAQGTGPATSVGELIELPVFRTHVRRSRPVSRDLVGQGPYV